MASSCYSRIKGGTKSSTTCKDTVFDWKCNDKEWIIFVLPGLEGRANGNMRSNNFYIKTKNLINPRRIALLLNSVNHFSPHLASPEGEGQILCFVIDW